VKKGWKWREKGRWGKDRGEEGEKMGDTMQIARSLKTGLIKR